MSDLALIALLAIPLIAGLLCFVPPIRRHPEPLCAGAAILMFALSLEVVVQVTVRHAIVHTWLYVDSLSALLILVVSLVSMVATLYSWGYMRTEIAAGDFQERNLGWYYGWLNLFVFGMLLSCLVSNLGVMWVAMEATTLFSAILVGIARHSAALEAAWKYLIICSVGIALALFGTALAYYASVEVFGSASNAMDWTVLVQAAHRIDPHLMRLSFAFILIGFGTKMGLAPMHTWLPDAHSQAPSPVSAVLSAALLNCSLYAILRYQAIAVRVLGPEYSSHLLLAFGLLSVAITVPFIIIQHDLKRLLAYSSVEHMGLIVVAVGIGGRAGLFAGLLHLVNHAMTKLTMFLTAGSLIQRWHTHNIVRLRGVVRRAPLLGLIFLGGVLALGGSPPFSIFLSEFSLLSAGINSGYIVVIVVLMLLLIAIFAGLLTHGSRLVLGVPARRAEIVPSSTGAVILTLPIVLIVVMGLHVPSALVTLIEQAVTLINGGAS